MVERQKPGPLTAKDFFDWTRASVNVTLEEAGRLGEAVQQSVGGLVKTLKMKGIKLPDVIEIQSVRPDSVSMIVDVLTYNPRDNSLTWASRHLLREGKDKKLRELAGREWLTYGLKVVDKLETVSVQNTANGKQ